MVSINDTFASKYLKAADLQGRAVQLKIADAKMECIDEQKNDWKLVIYFVGKTKGMICNRTNSLTLAEELGDESDNWAGATVELFPTKVPFQGKLTDALRVRVPPQRKAAAAPAQAATIAPNARARQAMVDMGENPPADGFDDTIPF